MSSIQWRIENVPEVDSTNDLALERARAGEPEGLVIAARSQRKGRGRLGRTWHSPPGCGLYFSALLRPSVPAERTALMSLIAGVAAAEGLADPAGCPVGLKWPNDLRIGGKKIGGILCEYENSGGPPPAVVAGIGINLKTPPEGFPEDFRDRATSLEEAGGGAVEADSALRQILERLDHWYREFLANGVETALRRWEGLCDNIAQEVTLSTANDAIEGTVAGIDGEGRLLLESPDGSLRAFDSGEVTEA
jgi:BirA family biotin operon repressor/biotin-[acetyl-CoA-carboxylase] ligase